MRPSRRMSFRSLKSSSSAVVSSPRSGSSPFSESMIWGAIAKNAPELPAPSDSQFLRRSARERKEQEPPGRPDHPAGVAHPASCLPAPSRFRDKRFTPQPRPVLVAGDGEIKTGAVMFSEKLLAGRNILVTGGGTGLGKSMAARFLELGAEVHICGRRKIVCD